MALYHGPLSHYGLILRSFFVGFLRNCFPSLANAQTLESSFIKGSSSLPFFTLTFVTRLNLRLARLLFSFSVSAVVIPVFGVFLLDRLIYMLCNVCFLIVHDLQPSATFNETFPVKLSSCQSCRPTLWPSTHSRQETCLSQFCHRGPTNALASQSSRSQILLLV
jgi:hypothetical protein